MRRWVGAAVTAALCAALMVPAFMASAAVPGDPDYRSGAVLTPELAPGCYANEITGMNLGSLDAMALPHPIRIGGTTYDHVYAGPHGAVNLESIGNTWAQPLNEEIFWGMPNIAVFAGKNSTYNFDFDTGVSDTPMTWGYTTWGLDVALCVTWTNVHPWVPSPSHENTPEYPDVWHWYDRGGWDTSRSNTFQVLIVPEPFNGDERFRLILNYDTVQWQSYDTLESDGTLTTAYPKAGFTAGDSSSSPNCDTTYACWLGYITGRSREGDRIPSLDWLDYPATHFQFDEDRGTGFLDTASTGLAVTSTNAAIPGRHVFTINERESPSATTPDIYDGVPSELVGTPWRSSDRWLDLTRYVALGDSYQSGEGASPFYTETDIPEVNLCHRSPDAYPVLLANSPIFEHETWGSPPTLEFWACSGATVKDLWNTYTSDSTRPWDDTKWADDRHNLSIPGWQQPTNLKSQMDRLTPDTAVVTMGIGGNNLGFVPILKACLKADTGTVLATAAEAISPAALPRTSCQAATNNYFDERFTQLIIPSTVRPDHDWESLLDQVHERSPDATVIVVGYPRLFPEQYAPFNGTVGDYCHGLLRSSQLYLNDLHREVRELQQRWSMKNGALFVDPSPLFYGYELCAGPDHETAINGIVARDPAQSFHPNARGNRIIANAVVRTLFSARAEQEALLQAEQTHTYFIEVPESLDLYLSLVYPGSDLPMTLISPSGRIITRDTIASDVTSTHGATWESFIVASAEVGTWTVEIYGADVNEGGEPYAFDYVLHDAANQKPEPAFELRREGDTVYLDATGSTDDGAIVDYQWFFDEDGQASGPTTSHTFSRPGEYHVILRVEDNRGSAAWLTYPSTITIESPATTGIGAPAGSGTSGRTGVIPAAAAPGAAPSPSASATAADPDEPPSSAPTPTAKPDNDTTDNDTTGELSTGLTWWAWVLLALILAGLVAIVATVVSVRRKP